MTEEQQELTDEEAIMKIAQAMKDNASSQDEKHNVHTFLTNIVQTTEIEKAEKVGNLRDGSKEDSINELGVPTWNVRGALEMARISDKLMGNTFFKEFFEEQAKETLFTSLSRAGFLIRQGTTSTKQVADITKRKTRTKGFLGKERIEETGGDTIA